MHDREPMMDHARGTAAAAALAAQADRGVRVPVWAAMAPMIPGATTDVFATRGALPNVLVVVRYEGGHRIWQNSDDAPSVVMQCAIVDGADVRPHHDPVRVRFARRMLGWLADASPDMGGYGKTAARQAGLVADGKKRWLSPRADEAVSETIWQQDPEQVALALAEAMDP